MTGIAILLAFLAAVTEPCALEAAMDQEEKSRAFSNSFPGELQFSDAVVLDGQESDLADALAGTDTVKRVAAARALWEGHSRRHAREVLQFVSGEPLKTKDFRALKRDVEDSLKPSAVLREGARLVLTRMGKMFSRLKVIWADSAYGRNDLPNWVKRTFNWILQTILRPVGAVGFVLLPKRWVVERTFAWLGRYRRHSKDYERTTESSEAMILISMIHLMSRRLVQLKT
jgi:transposase